DAEHPPERPGEVSGIGKARRVRGGGERRARDERVEDGREAQPENVPPEAHSDLRGEDMSETTGREPNAAREVAARRIALLGGAAHAERGSEGRSDGRSRARGDAEPVHDLTEETGGADGVEL